MINFSFTTVAKLIFAFILAFLQSDAAAAHTSMLTVGDQIDGMILTTGAADARPLWAFCSSNVEENVTTANCRVPQVSKLAIGYILPGIEAELRAAELSEFHWELYLDDAYINLNDFGAYDYLLLTIAPKPSRVREVFIKFTAWDVVLTNLQPGIHTLEGRVFNAAEEYSWNVTLEIGEPSLGNLNNTQETQSGCPSGGGWLSRMQGSCRLYG